MRKRKGPLLHWTHEVSRDSRERAEETSILGKVKPYVTLSTNYLKSERPSSEALPHVYRIIQEEDDSLGYSWEILRPLSTRGEYMPILQFRKPRSWVGTDWRQNLRISDYFGWSHITFDTKSMQKYLYIGSNC